MEVPDLPDTTGTERALLGSILAEPLLWPETADVAVDDFLLKSHRLIYGEMARLAEDGQKIDIVFLAQRLDNHIEEIGGVAYLGNLVDYGMPANISAYVRAVKQGALRRKLARQAENLERSLCSPNLDHDDLQRQIREMADAVQTGSTANISVFNDIPDIFGLDIRPTAWRRACSR